MPVPGDKARKSAFQDMIPNKSLASMMGGGIERHVSPSAQITSVPNHPFLLVHHPMDWQVCSLGLSEPTILPGFRKVVLQAGVNNVRTLKKGEPFENSFKTAISKLKEKNNFIIDWHTPVPQNCLPEGVPYGKGYLRSLTCIHPMTQKTGLRWVEVWEVPISSVPGAASAFKFHHAEYNRWRLHMLEGGAVPAILESVYEELRRRYKWKINRVRTTRAVDKELKEEKLERLKKELAVFEEAKVLSGEEEDLYSRPVKSMRDKGESTNA